MAGIFQLPEELWRQIQAHLQANLPEEACGLIGGAQTPELASWKADQVYPVENILHSPTRYRMEGGAQLAAFEEIDRAGLELIAVFHSHPQGPIFPSETDRKELYYEVIQLICYLQASTWQCRGYQLINNNFHEIELLID